MHADSKKHTASKRELSKKKDPRGVRVAKKKTTILRFTRNLKVEI